MTARANAGEDIVCTNPHCLVAVPGVEIACAAGSENRTLPPSWTPYPSAAPTPYGTMPPFPTIAPINSNGESVTEGDLNGAGVLSPYFGVFGGRGGGGCGRLGMGLVLVWVFSVLAVRVMGMTVIH